MNRHLAWYGISKVNEISRLQIKNLLEISKVPENIFNLSKEKLVKARV